jgi:hypothetical protein
MVFKDTGHWLVILMMAFAEYHFLVMFIAHSLLNELDKSIQKLFELRSHAVIRAIKPPKTLLG